VEAAVLLSVSDRSAPVETAVNGTLVARQARMTPVPVSRTVGSTLTVRCGPASVTTASWARARRARGSRVGRLELHCVSVPSVLGVRSPFSVP
jgi:hypothetical protein